MEDRKSISTAIPTDSGLEQQGIALGPFSGGQVHALLASCFFGLLVGGLLGKSGLPLSSCLLCGVTVPTLISVILLRLVVGKPAGYFSDYIQEQWIRLFGCETLQLQPRETPHEEQI